MTTVNKKLYLLVVSLILTPLIIANYCIYNSKNDASNKSKIINGTIEYFFSDYDAVNTDSADSNTNNLNCTIVSIGILHYDSNFMCMLDWSSHFCLNVTRPLLYLYATQIVNQSLPSSYYFNDGFCYINEPQKKMSAQLITAIVLLSLYMLICFIVILYMIYNIYKKKREQIVLQQTIDMQFQTSNIATVSEQQKDVQLQEIKAEIPPRLVLSTESKASAMSSDLELIEIKIDTPRLTTVSNLEPIEIRAETPKLIVPNTSPNLEPIVIEPGTNTLDSIDLLVLDSKDLITSNDQVSNDQVSNDQMSYSPKQCSK